VGGAWHTVGRGTVIGHRNLLRIGRVSTSRARLVVDRAKACPALAEVGFYFSERDTNWGSRSLAAHKPAKASNVHPGGTVWGADKAVDDDRQTRWATSDETRACWLDVDLLKPALVGEVHIAELQPRIQRFEIQYKLKPADAWKVAHSGQGAGLKFNATFAPVKARFIRLNILEATFAPTIWEFQVFPPSRSR
jgi:hypothetical protein